MRAKRDAAQQGENDRQTCYQSNDASLEHTLPAFSATYRGAASAFFSLHPMLQYSVAVKQK
jgi:hypothetical protein